MAAVVAAVDEVCAREARGGRARLALCAAGRPGRDGRGLAVVRHGPRDPRLLDRVEEGLAVTGLVGGTGPAEIHSDGTAAGWGEEWAVDGAFAGVANAYLVGCGTGVAEALKVDGQLLEPSAFPGDWRAPWEADADGGCAEDRVSMAVLARRWRELAPDASEPFPEAAARSGSALAAGVLADTAEDLARFIAARIAHLDACGVRLQRVVLGQRAADLFADAALRRSFADPLVECLSVAPSAVPARELVVASRLRAAPALGAVALTRRALRQEVGG